MVEHSVTIEHEFKTPNGSAVLVTISQQDAAITIRYKLAGDASAVVIDREDVPQLLALFGEVAKLVAPQTADATANDILPQTEP